MLTQKELEKLRIILKDGEEAENTARYVVVVDRGWIFAGDLTVGPDGYIRLSRAVHVFKWVTIGFARMITEWKTDKVTLRKCEDVEIPPHAVIFRVPVESTWGIV